MLPDDFGDITDAAVGRDDQVERTAMERFTEGLAEMRISDDPFDRTRDLVTVMGAAMHDRDIVALRDQTIDQIRSGRSGAANDKCFQLINPFNPAFAR